MSTSRILRAGAGPAAAPSLAELETPAERHRREAGAGWHEGYQAGLRAARAELGRASTEAIAELEARRSRTAQLCGVLEQAVADARALTASRAAETVEGLGRLACDLAEAILERELRSDPEAVVAAVRRAAALVPDTPATVTVHPVDVEIAASHSGGGLLEFRADPTVEPGGCVLRAGAASVDGQIISALARARAAFDGATPPALTSPCGAGGGR